MFFFKKNYGNIVALQCCVSLCSQQSEAVACVPAFPLLWTSSHLGHHRALSRGVMLRDFRLSWKATVIKTVRDRHKSRHVDQQEGPE